MRVITRRATMLAGDQSQGMPRRSRGVVEVEAQLRHSRGAISPASILSESRNYPNCVHCIGTYSILCDFGAYTSFYAYTWIQFEKVEIAVIIAHLT